MPHSRPARLTALALLAACCACGATLAFAPAPAHREPKADRRADEEKLQGTWELVSQSADGIAVPTRSGESTAVFAGRRASYRTRGKEFASWSFSLDPNASPKRIDLRNREGTNVWGVYRLEGDRLTLACKLAAPRARLTDFKGGRGVLVSVYRRAKRGK